jgi:hypothetical protein
VSPGILRRREAHHQRDYFPDRRCKEERLTAYRGASLVPAHFLHGTNANLAFVNRSEL